MTDQNPRTDAFGGTSGVPRGDWATDEKWWRENYSSRPYAKADRGFDFYAPAYRYGSAGALRHRSATWDEVEPELRSGWDRYEHRGAARSTWEDIKDAVRDAWDRVTGDRNVNRDRY